MSNFGPNAILRGAQLTLVGAHRCLQNPGLFTSNHYRQAALAVVAGIAIRLVVAIPVLGIKAFLGLYSVVSKGDEPSWGEDVAERLHFIEHSVLQLPFFLMSLMRYLSPALDQMFMDSLAWVDRTYIQKHRSEDPQNLRAMYHANLKMYPANNKVKSPMGAATAFLIRYGRRAGLSLAVYLLSFLPVVGRLVLPAASFWTFKEAVGVQPALAIFGGGVLLPRRYLVVFLQSYFSSRSLMRGLLEPYFSRIRYTREQKRLWFRDREGVLFGFALGFFVLLKIPLLGVLIYGVAEASTAYLITKITEPPPPPSEASQFVESQLHWHNKHEFVALPLANLDAHNVQGSGSPITREVDTPRKKFS